MSFIKYKRTNIYLQNNHNNFTQGLLYDLKAVFINIYMTNNKYMEYNNKIQKYVARG